MRRMGGGDRPYTRRGGSISQHLILLIKRSVTPGRLEMFLTQLALFVQFREEPSNGLQETCKLKAMRTGAVQIFTYNTNGLWLVTIIYPLKRTFRNTASPIETNCHLRPSTTRSIIEHTHRFLPPFERNRSGNVKLLVSFLDMNYCSTFCFTSE